MDASLGLIDISASQKFNDLPKSAQVTIKMVINGVPVTGWDQYIRDMLLTSGDTRYWKATFEKHPYSPS
jgi:hypothetical protein